MPPIELQRRLDALDILAELSAEQRAALAAELQVRAIERGAVLVRQGDSADALYIVVSGRFAVTVSGRAATLCEIGAGQPIGEIAFLTGQHRTATVQALRDSLVLQLDKAAFERLADRNPGIWRALATMLAGRLGAATAAASRPEPVPKARMIAVVRAGPRAVPPAFLDRLDVHLQAAGRTLRLGAQELARHLPAGEALDGHVATEMLNALESRYDYVLLVADDDMTAFSEKIVRHADLLLAVGMAGSDSAPSEIETVAARYVPPAGRWLVLVHPDRRRPTGTARWLDRRDIALNHHVALCDDQDIARLVRFIDGRATGLVACGGGALCNAHVGVYAAFRDAGCSFDMMGGTSAGSAMTGAFALGWTPEEIDAAVHDIFVTHGAMRRYTVPWYSLLDHTHFDRQLSRHYGGIDIEDLWLPFFAVSANLTTRQVQCHRRGDLWQAIRASSSIPVLLPPVYTDGGEMLVDGALLDNVPIAVMRSLKQGPNAVVNFHTPDNDPYSVDYQALPSRARLALDLLLPWRRKRLPAAPGLTHVLMRSMTVNRGEFLRDLTGDDVLLVPPLPAGLGFLDWHRHTEVHQAARRWAAEEVDRLIAAGHPLVKGAMAPR